MKKKLSKVLTSLALCFAIGGLFTACKDGKPGEPGAQGPVGPQGEAGKSAYQLWLEQDGNAGKTVEEFLASLVGANGANGTDGANGSNGQSAYELWLAAGNEGTEADFLASLIGQKGDQGDKGEDGKSAYEIWLEQGNEGTEEDFLVWLKGGCLHTNKVAWLTRDHFMEDGVVKAGCTIYHCTDCNLGVIEFESEIKHDYTEVEHKATCTEGGYVGLECTICGYHDTTGETPALGHTEAKYQINDPTKSICTDGSSCYRA